MLSTVRIFLFLLLKSNVVILGLTGGWLKNTILIAQLVPVFGDVGSKAAVRGTGKRGGRGGKQ